MASPPANGCDELAIRCPFLNGASFLLVWKLSDLVKVNRKLLCLVGQHIFGQCCIVVPDMVIMRNKKAISWDVALYEGILSAAKKSGTGV